MSEHENHEPPAKYSYSVGAGLGLLIGGAIGLFTDSFLIDAILGIAIGLVVTYLVKFLRP
jgi:hypothetical protein